MTSNQKLRWGILGAARVNERLLPAIIEAGNSELVAIASRRPGAAAETLQKYAPKVRGVATYDTLEELLADKNVEAIYIPMANHEHGEWALKAIASGRHVLVEKPLAITVADIEAIEAAAAKYKVKVMEGFMYRFHPQHQRVKEIIQSGAIGEVRSAKASYSFMMRPARMYRLANDTDLGGGAMWDVGPYAIHSLRHCFDSEPVSVTAMAKYADTGADISTSGILQFGDGRHGHFDVSFECSRQSEYTIIGTKGSVKCHTVWQLPGTNDLPVISWWSDDGRKFEESYPAANHFNLEIEHFSDCVLNDKAPLLTLQDAKINCKTIAAVLESAFSGRSIKIN
ncbi:MAG TPA: Gfo/Idh/MocA family oxidoreductase [Methylophilaceae bacterium]|nr:Gfo/Idh/MocA family oxidoreductase [Methylophilaceae bacterium]